ncbi:MAG: RidA family protein [Cyclobacteriaceae bacterium]|nr:RidA family protein [Cyclobacteriaceae bacterium]
MSKTIIKTSKAPLPIGPYSQAVRAGNTLYVSGQIALNPETGNLISGDAKEQTQAVMHHLEAILKAAGMGFQDVVKCSIFVKNMSDFATVNEVYGSFFEQNPPARETVEVSRLPKDVLVEISCIACV